MCETTDIRVIVFSCVELQPHICALANVDFKLKSRRKRIGLMNIGADTIFEIAVVLTGKH
jgi:hypothetical protein